MAFANISDWVQLQGMQGVLNGPEDLQAGRFMGGVLTQGDYAGPPSPGNPYAPNELYGMGDGGGVGDWVQLRGVGGGVGDWVQLRGMQGLGATTDAVAKARAELAATRAKRAEVQQQKAALQNKNSGGGAFPALVSVNNTAAPGVTAEGAKSMILPLALAGAGVWFLMRGK